MTAYARTAGVDMLCEKADVYMYRAVSLPSDYPLLGCREVGRVLVLHTVDQV